MSKPSTRDISHFLPDVIVRTSGRMKARFETHFREKYPVTVIATPKTPQLIFLRSEPSLSPTALMAQIRLDETAWRHVSLVLLTRHYSPDLSTVAMALQQAQVANPTMRVRVVAFPKTVAAELIQLCPDIEFDPREFTTVCYVVAAYHRYHYAVEPAAVYLAACRSDINSNHVVNDNGEVEGEEEKSGGSGGSRPLEQGSSGSSSSGSSSKSVGKEVSRAERKLTEVLNLLSYTLPTVCNAVDIGASPGGWTLVLAKRGAQVLAIDPGLLADAVVSLPNVRHLEKRVEECSQELNQTAPFDLLLCDINLDARDACRMMVSLAWCLKPEGLLVFTVKSFHPRKANWLAGLCVDLLSSSLFFRDIKVHWLFANSYERTITAFRTDIISDQQPMSLPGTTPRSNEKDPDQEGARLVCLFCGRVYDTVTARQLHQRDSRHPHVLPQTLITAQDARKK